MMLWMMMLRWHSWSDARGRLSELECITNITYLLYDRPPYFAYLVLLS